MTYYTWIPFFVMAIDQLTKRMAIHFHYNQIEVILPFFENKIVWNKGISFGMLGDSYYNVLLYCAICLALVLIIMTWVKAKSKLDVIAWGLIVGGGISNLFDRWLFGAVLDFIYLSYKEISFPWIFNLADIAITIGAILLMRRLFKKGGKKAHDNQKAK